VRKLTPKKPRIINQVGGSGTDSALRDNEPRQDEEDFDADPSVKQERVFLFGPLSTPGTAQNAVLKWKSKTIEAAKNLTRSSPAMRTGCVMGFPTLPHVAPSRLARKEG
jgi:hypothetical protein